jgi:hypothetical protein
MITDAATAFFNEVATHGHIPMLGRVTGTIRFDLVDGQETDSYFVTIKDGDVALSDNRGDADCVVRTDRALFEQLATGEANALAATLRGQVIPTGKTELLVNFQRLFPGPSMSRQNVKASTKGERT